MTKKQKILLVDDEPQLLKSCRALLAAAGYTVMTASGGEEAIQLLQKDAHDLVLLDLNMPDISGHEVMEFINSNNIDSSVIAISGETSFDWVSKAFILGAYDYVQKPYEFDVLLHTITNALRKRELENDFSRLRKQLERSEKLHRFMIESSPDMIFIVDRKGFFAFVNDRAEDLLGYKKDQIIGMHYSEIVAPDCLEKAEYCFSERSSEEPAMRAAEIFLNRKASADSRQNDTKRLAIELNALGVYEDEEWPEASGDPDKGFSGTYVVARDITLRLESERLIHYQAFHDLLTGLPNRVLFLDRLSIAISNAKRKKSKLAVMFVDLDRFKVVNDTLGHAVGDKLLQGVAARLKASLREGDTLARLGGDEFIVLLPGVESELVAQKVAAKIISSVKAPFKVDNHELFVTASLGISMFPHDGDSAEALIKNSDIAMYHTKGEGKNGYKLYEDDMSIRQEHLLNMENDIRRGIKENQFEVFYQPQVSSVNGEITGVEALLRWNHPEQGLLSPAYFLSIAEESGLIVELGGWVLHSALEEMSNWREAGIDVGKLAINFSARQIEQKDFVERIIFALKKYDFPGESLEIEITESSLINDIDNIIVKLKQLHNVGVHVAIDDFGTGYSSLSLLQKLPINRLKIDKSFVANITEDTDHSIIEAIIQMAKGLKLDMVAEGVEKDYQLRYLQKLQCPVIQGFIYSRGVPAADARKLLASCASRQIQKSPRNSRLKRSA
ncbi:MAG: EAL domain-containing protein [Pseudomonadales bacterium]|nr:EAL domain-containing protein [Pseudomonadales bacterium]